MPNIVFVFADQLRYSALASSGNTVVRTPNLDRLAEQGVVFDNAFSNCPICSPFRGSLFTGRYPHQNGVIDNEYAFFPDEVTLPQLLTQAGYRTGFVGKWHLGYGPYAEDKRHGFDYMAAHNCEHSYYEVSYHENGDGPHAMGGWAPEVETELVLRYLEHCVQEDRGRPLALFLGWGPPHWPYDQYPEEHRVYRPESVDLPPNVPAQMEHFARQELAHYYGNVTGLDAQFGRLVAKLEELGMADNTILCFTSDHGDHIGSHGYGKPFDLWLHHTKRCSKATPHEESIHIPFILRYPEAVPAGRRTQTLLGSVDMMPTLLGLCGLDIPEPAAGEDLSHAALGGSGGEPDSVYLQILGPGWPHRGKWVGFWRGLRTERWTYARWWRNETEPWLYDRETDPWEMNNLAGRPESAETQAQMEARLQQWMAETNDPFDAGERDPDTGILKLGQQYTHPGYEQDG
jgi:arylsulfatase A-like enzyme